MVDSIRVAVEVSIDYDTRSHLLQSQSGQARWIDDIIALNHLSELYGNSLNQWQFQYPLDLSDLSIECSTSIGHTCFPIEFLVAISLLISSACLYSRMRPETSRFWLNISILILLSWSDHWTLIRMRVKSPGVFMSLKHLTGKSLGEREEIPTVSDRFSTSGVVLLFHWEEWSMQIFIELVVRPKSNKCQAQCLLAHFTWIPMENRLSHKIHYLFPIRLDLCLSNGTTTSTDIFTIDHSRAKSAARKIVNTLLPFNTNFIIHALCGSKPLLDSNRITFYALSF